MSQPTVIGVDLGGTNVRACAYYEDGSAAGPKFSNPSNAQSGSQAIFESITHTVLQAQSASTGAVQAVGMAIPGIVDFEQGKVVWAPNFGQTVDGVFRYWEDVDIRGPLESATGLKFYLNNDANLAALGEYRFGTGRNSAACLVMLTMGTGIGGGVVMSAKSVAGQASGTLLLLGGNQGGVELGHTVVEYNGLDCSAGTYGTVEAYCQRDSIVKRALHRLQRGRESALRAMIGDNFAQLTPKHLGDAAAAGDELAIEVLGEVGAFLGVAIGNMINIFAPDIVAIGGQVAKSGEFLLGPARKTARNIAIPKLFEFATIVEAIQVEDAGLLGGAALALQAVQGGSL